MRIQRESRPAVASSTATAKTSAKQATSPTPPTASALPADSFAAATPSPMALSMSAAPGTTAVADSTWYRLKKEVILTFTGVNYDPHAARLGDAAAQKMREVLQPGDVLLRRTDGTTSNWFIPGTWGHAALYAGDGKIVDAVTHDVRETDVEQFCKEGDAVIIVRPKNLQAGEVEKAIAYARAQIGKPYDFDLDFEDESRFTCTELVETSLKKATGKAWVPDSLLGISPKDFLNDNFQFVWSNLAQPTK